MRLTNYRTPRRTVSLTRTSDPPLSPCFGQLGELWKDANLLDVLQLAFQADSYLLFFQGGPYETLLVLRSRTRAVVKSIPPNGGVASEYGRYNVRQYSVPEGDNQLPHLVHNVPFGKMSEQIISWLSVIVNLQTKSALYNSEFQ